MVELTLLKLARPELDTDVEALVDRVARLERAVQQGGTQDGTGSQVAGRRSQVETASRDPKRETQDDDPEAPFESPKPAQEPEPTQSSPAVERRAAPNVRPTPNDERPAPADETPTEDSPSDERPAPSDDRAVELTLEAVQAAWPQVFGSMRQALGPRRQALFREALPGAVHDGILELWVPGHLEFHLEQLRGDDEVQQLVADRVADLLGGRPSVRFEARPDGATPTAAAAPEIDDDEPLPDKHTLEEAPAEDATALLAELGGEVIEDVTYDR